MALRVFPPNVTQPRKSSLKKPRTGIDSERNAELKGVAFQVDTARTSPVIVQNGDQHVKHSLFSDVPTTSSNSSKLGSLRRGQRASDRLSAASENTIIRCDSPLEGEDDALAPLPENGNFGNPSSQTRLVPGVERPRIPLNLSTEVLTAGETAVSPGGDRLSPLPERDRFSPASPPKPEYPAARSLRSTSPTLVSGDSPASTAPPYSPPQPSRQKSIFPRWDPNKPLGEQQYYPHLRSTTPTLPTEKVSKAASPVYRKHAFPPLDLQHVESLGTVVVGYEHIPMANSTDLIEVWNASCGKYPAGVGRKSLFRLIQPRGKGTTLGIGVSEDSVVWSMKKEGIPTTDKDAEPSDQLTISKNAPGNPSPNKVASLALPKPSSSETETKDEIVGIFPHMAAIHAIEMAATSAAATAIAKVDPTAKSPEAARLAQDAIAEARRHYQSLLIRTNREREGMGAVTATYQLQHPTLGAFAMTVTKSTAGRHSRDPRAKISLHHPSATPAAISAETLVLASLDFARDACVLDVPALLALEGSYIIDTVICALLGVAVIENDALMAEAMTFAAPPKSPLPLAKNSSNAKASTETTSNEPQRAGGLFKRNKKKKKKDELELPVLTKGALALLGMSFKVAVWTLELGVKATAGVIITTSHIVQKA